MRASWLRAAVVGGTVFAALSCGQPVEPPRQAPTPVTAPASRPELLADAVPPPPPPQGDPARYRDFLFGVCYYPEQWPERYWEADARRMAECGVNAVRMGEFAWYLMEPAEGQFDFSVFDRAIDLMGRHGIKTILGTPTATPPKWLTQKYPDVLHVYEDGRPADAQSRRHYCYSSPRYRELSRRVVEKMVDHFRGNPNVIGWQIDNEMNNENKACFSDACRDAFRAWLRAKYGTLDELNRRWGTGFWSQHYTAWEQIDLPHRTPAWHNPALFLDHKRFVSDSATAYMEDQLRIIRDRRPDDFVTHNGIFKGIDYRRFARGLDLYAHDNYPTFLPDPLHPTQALLTAARSFTGRFMIMEQLTGPAGQTYLLSTPAPGQVRLWAMQAVAHGADGVLHFRWRTALRGAEQYWYGVLDHDDVPRERFADFAREGRELRRVGAEVLGSTVKADVAVLHDYEDDWVLEHQYLTSEVNRDAGINLRAELVDFCRAASNLKYGIDFAGPGADLRKYKVVFAPHLILLDEDLAARIRAFVEGGGTFVMAAQGAVKDRDNAMTDRTMPILIGDLLGAELAGFQCYQPPSAGRNALKFGDGTDVAAHVFADRMKPTTARTVATWDKDFFAGQPACTENAVGKGKAVWYGSFFDAASAEYLMRRYGARQGIRPLLPDVPPQVEVTVREKGDRRFYFLLNHAAEPATVKLGGTFADVLAGTAAADPLQLDAYGYRVLVAR